jgi:hypothetical protein
VAGVTELLRLASPSDTDNQQVLEGITGPIRSVVRSPLTTTGFSGASHERLELALQSGARRSLVVKRLRVPNDWIARRTADRTGREAAVLAEPALAPIWSAFACPYVAFAAADGEIALVMDDLSPFLFPDVREPLEESQEERLLVALATLHAGFWTAPGTPSPVLDLPVLASPEHHIGLLDACSAVDPGAVALLPDALRDTVTRGWTAALEPLSAPLFALMTTPPEEMRPFWEGLPRTLIHGDVKVANFALLPDGRVAAFDWALVGSGPASIDLGWYLAVNATRLARSKDETLARYRRLLTARLSTPLPNTVWATLVRSAIIFGARMLLWSKALAVEAERPGALAEWNWWIEQLEAACS